MTKFIWNPFGRHESEQESEAAVSKIDEMINRRIAIARNNVVLADKPLPVLSRSESPNEIDSKETDTVPSSTFPSSNITPISAHLYESSLLGSFSDITIILFSKPYHLHKIILSRIPWFVNNILRNEKQSEVIIDLDIEMEPSSNAVNVVLAWIYGKKIELSFESTSNIEINWLNVLDVLRISLFFGIWDLINMCLEYIVEYECGLHQDRLLFVKRHNQSSNIIITVPSPSDRILKYLNFVDSALADVNTGSEIFIIIEDALLKYICREGYESLEDVFVDMSNEWLQKILEADSFWYYFMYFYLIYIIGALQILRDTSLLNALSTDEKKRKHQLQSVTNFMRSCFKMPSFILI